MPDPTDPAEPVETAQDAVEPAEPTSSPAFDGEFDPDRARRTIDHLRSREKELEQQARELERLRTDPDAFKSLGTEVHGYSFEDAPVYDDEPEDVNAALTARIDALEAERQADRLQAKTFETNAKELEEIQASAGRDLSPDEIETLIGLAPKDEHGIPHIKPVWEAANKLFAPKVDPPSISELGSPSGGQGSEQFDIRDRRQRIDRMVSVMEAAAKD